MRDSVLVVGGAGYIGSHTTKLLRKLGRNTIVLDDLSTGHEAAVRRALPKGPFYRGSYSDPRCVREILEAHQIGTILHFGARAIVEESVEDPLSYYASNVGGTIELLNAAVAAKVERFVFSSTCATFGVPEKSPISENLRQSPLNPYGSTKWMVERILKDLAERGRISVAVLRYFNAAGADPEGELGECHANETHLIPRCIEAGLGKRSSFAIHGADYPTPDGTCIRDYVHVNDLADAHVRAIDHLARHRGYDDFNLGSAKGHSVKEVISAVSRVLGAEVPHTIGPRRAGDPPQLVADSSKARAVLGWEPKIDFPTIVRTATDWIRKNPKGFAA